MRHLRKVASGLLSQRDPQRRRLLILTYSVVLLLLFLAHTYFSRLSSPLKLMPQTGLAMAMGYVLLHIVSLSQFKYLADFINWDKVAEVADPRRGFEVVPPADAPPRGNAAATPDDHA